MLEYLSDAALGRAFSRVMENHGCAGTDGVDLGRFAASRAGALAELREAVASETYWAWPLRRVEIEKRPGSEERRTLVVPAVRDRVLQTAVAAHIEPVLEREFDDCSFAYRRGRSVRMAVERVQRYYLEGYRWLVDADIDEYFSSVDRGLLLGRVATVVHDETIVRLIALWLDYAVWDGLHLLRPPLGIAQGSVISPMLANLCLDALDDRLLAEGIRYVRYADDFVILAKSRKGAERAYELAEETLAGLRLRLDEGKTRIVRFSEGFRFLGVIFLKDLLVQPFRAAKRLKVLSVAGVLPPAFFPASERRALRQYRSC